MLNCFLEKSSQIEFPVTVLTFNEWKEKLTYSPRLKAGDSSINNKCRISPVLLRLL